MVLRRNAGSTYLLALALAAGAGLVPPSTATAQGYPRIPLWAYPGAWQDSTVLVPRRCGGSFTAPLADSVRAQARTITVRFRRDPQAELRREFGGYRIYRVVQTPDTAQMVMLRRYTINLGDSLFNWHFSSVDRDPASPTYGRFVCDGVLASDSIVTFVDPDSSGSYQKVCRRVDHLGRCLSPGDSVFKLVAPAGPHDGFLTWYSVTYEARNETDNSYEDLFVPDLSFDTCARNPITCPNLNNKRANMFPDPNGSQHLEPTRGEFSNLLRVAVVPNPYRANEAWDPAGGHELHFINLPRSAKIQIFTVAGDLVQTLHHDDPTRDFERWNLRNARGQEVAAGIYMYRVDSTVAGEAFTFQNRFIVIR